MDGDYGGRGIRFSSSVTHGNIHPDRQSLRPRMLSAGECAMHRRDGAGALADGGGDALHRSAAHVPGGEHPGDRRLERQRFAAERLPLRERLRTAMSVPVRRNPSASRSSARQPGCRGVRADEAEQAAGVDRADAVDADPLERSRRRRGPPRAIRCAPPPAGPRRAGRRGTTTSCVPRSEPRTTRRTGQPFAARYSDA